MCLKLGREHLVLALIFVLVLGIRLFLVFHEGNLDYDSYFVLRQAEHIHETGLPMFADSLSYSGRTLFFPPLFHYLLAGVSLIMPLEIAAKLLPNILFAILAVVVFIISKELTKNKTAALMAAFFTGLVPIAYRTINTASVTSLSIIFVFLLSYTFMRLDEKGFPTLCIIIAVLMLFTEASIFILLLSLVLFFLMLRLQSDKPAMREIELTVFIFFLGVWFNILLYKKAFFIHGLSVIWGNMPVPLLSSYFQDLDFVGILYAVGVIPLLFGVYAIYHVFFKTKSRSANLYISFAIVSFLMLWFKIIPLTTGLLFLSINIIILSSLAIKTLLVSFSRTKIAYMERIIIISIIVLFLLTALPSFFDFKPAPSPKQQDLDALYWLKNNTSPEAVVLADVREGFLLNYLAERKDVADSNFLLISNINNKYNDVESIYRLRLKSEAVRLINYYNINYILLSRSTMEKYNQTELFYADPDCFEKSYDESLRGGAIIYKFMRCKI
jgi:hypothetical protein